MIINSDFFYSNVSMASTTLQTSGVIPAVVTPEPNELPIEAAARRLDEEMGISCDLVEVFTHLYRIEFTPEMKEHEFDHVFFGLSDDRPAIDTAEAQDYRYVSLAELDEDIRLHPECYTYWLREILPKVRGVWGFVKMLTSRGEGG